MNNAKFRRPDKRNLVIVDKRDNLQRTLGVKYVVFFRGIELRLMRGWKSEDVAIHGFHDIDFQSRRHLLDHGVEGLGVHVQELVHS